MNQIEDRNAVSDDGYNEMQTRLPSYWDIILIGLFMLYGATLLVWDWIERTLEGRAVVYVAALVLFVRCALWYRDQPLNILAGFTVMLWTADRLAKVVMEEARGPS